MHCCVPLGVRGLMNVSGISELCILRVAWGVLTVEN